MTSRPGRLLPDSAIVDAARTLPKRPADLGALKVFSGPRQKRRLGQWFAAVETALALARHRAAADRRKRRRRHPARPRAGAIAIRWQPTGWRAAVRWSPNSPTQHTVLAQNLLASDVIRRLAWQPPQPLDETAVRARLAEIGARPWQVDLTAAALTAALAG